MEFLSSQTTPGALRGQTLIETLTEEVGQTLTDNIDDYETIDTTLVGSLTAGHLGLDIVLVVEKTYRYAGEDRSKVTTFYGPLRVEHYRTSGKKQFQSRMWGRPESTYYNCWSDLNSMDSVVVMRKKAK